MTAQETPYALYMVRDGQKRLMDTYATFQQAGEAADAYRALFADNSELRIERKRPDEIGQKK